MELWRTGIAFAVAAGGCGRMSAGGGLVPVSGGLIRSTKATTLRAYPDKQILQVSHDLTEQYWNSVKSGKKYEVTIRPDTHNGFFAWIAPFGATRSDFRASVKATPSLLVQQTNEGKPGAAPRPLGDLKVNCFDPMFEQIIDKNDSRHFTFTITRRKDTKLGEFDVEVQELPATPAGHRTFLLSETGLILGFMPAG